MSTVYLVVIATLCGAIGLLSLRYELKARKEKKASDKRERAARDAALASLKKTNTLNEKKEELRSDTEKEISRVTSIPDGKSAFDESIKLLHGRRKRKNAT